MGGIAALIRGITKTAPEIGKVGEAVGNAVKKGTTQAPAGLLSNLASRAPQSAGAPGTKGGLRISDAIGDLASKAKGFGSMPSTAATGAAGAGVSAASAASNLTKPTSTTSQILEAIKSHGTLARGDSPLSSAGSSATGKSESMFSRVGSAVSSAMSAMSPMVAGAEGLAGTAAGAAGAVSEHTNSTSMLGQGVRLAGSIASNAGTAGMAQLNADSSMSTAWKMANIENERQMNDMLVNQAKEETKSIADAARPAT